MRWGDSPVGPGTSWYAWSTLHSELYRFRPGSSICSWRNFSNICCPATSARPFDRLCYATVLACRMLMCLHIVLNHVPTN